jgi:hypothetical protein
LPARPFYSVAFSPSGDVIAISSFNAPYLVAYSWSSSTGFGTKYANPASPPTGSVSGIAFSPSNDAIAADFYNFSFSAYQWNTSTGFGARFTTTGLASGGYTGSNVAFSPQGNQIAGFGSSSPYIYVYPWSGSGFGTKYANPSTLPNGGTSPSGGGVAFSPSGDALAAAHDSTPYITVYPWSPSGFGTKYSNPATLPTGIGTGVAFSPAGNAIAVAHGTSPFISAYPWSTSGFGTKYSNPATLPTGNSNSVAFSPSGNAIAVGHDTSPYITVYPWSP